MKTKQLNKNHLKRCLCFFCVQARERYTHEEWKEAIAMELDICIHCNNEVGSHAGGWEEKGIIADGGCLIGSLLKNGIASEAFVSYNGRYSSEYTFDKAEK